MSIDTIAERAAVVKSSKPCGRSRLVPYTYAFITRPPAEICATHCAPHRSGRSNIQAVRPQNIHRFSIAFGQPSARLARPTGGGAKPRLEGNGPCTVRPQFLQRPTMAARRQDEEEVPSEWVEGD